LALKTVVPTFPTSSAVIVISVFATVEVKPVTFVFMYVFICVAAFVKLPPTLVTGIEY